jgi:PIN domain nuclease of toxin-antitoxin system
VKLLLDTHLLLWAAYHPERLSDAAVELIKDRNHDIWFSAVSLWEISIKSALGRRDFQIDPAAFRCGLLDNLYEELPMTGEHAIAIQHLPLLHKDPFDRALIAQALVAGLVLVTSDAEIADYPGAIVRV